MSLHTILVVDDEAAIRKMLNAGLKSFGYEVLVAANGTEALAITPAQKPDLVILDINLASFPDGVEVCYRIRQFSTVPILIL
jgi:two-component system, OmpR family, KDP operon response regulator KdpE